MIELLGVALSFPSVIFTVLLGVVLAYWLFVIAGAVHIDALGGGGEGALHLDGAESALGHVDALSAGEANVDLGGADASLADGGAHHAGIDADGGGGVTGAIAALRLRSVPATVVLSFIIIFSWLLSVLGTRLVGAHLEGALAWTARLALLVGSPLASLPVTSLAIRPFASFFVTRGAKGRDDLVGRVCVIRTGSVDQSFGEATLEDGGAGLVVRVRIDGAASLRRGDQALIVAWDTSRDAFTVAPMDELLAEKRRS